MKKYQTHIILTIIFCMMAFAAHARRMSPRDAFSDSVMCLVFKYAQTVDTAGRAAHKSYAYTKFQIKTNKRNATLMLVPTMYAVAHGGGRRFISEYYNQMTLDAKGKPVAKRLLNISTIPHRSNTLSSVLKYMTPTVYGETLFETNILSPFHQKNRRYYKYAVTQLPFGKAQIYVYPRLKNTQVIEARAIVDSKTGKISMVDFEGEYDMTRFYISIIMGRDGFGSLSPAKCSMRANFSFLGNKITGMYTTVYGLPKILSDSLNNVADTTLMAKVRPIELNQEETDIYNRFYEKRKQVTDSLNNNIPKTNFAKDILWDVIGDNVLNRISQGFGKQNQGYFRISPILNPLYMGYSERKGVVYKFDLKGSYRFTEDLQLGLRFKGGYSMKQHRFYFRIPLTFNYNQKHNGYIKLEIGNGNRISNNRVARKMLGISKPEDNDFLYPLFSGYPGLALPEISTDIDANNRKLTEFKDDYLRLTNHWSFNDYVGFEIGLVSHQRKAVIESFYKLFNYPSKYVSVAPAVALELLPWGKKGSIFKIDYEKGWKNLLGSNIDYERVEVDAQTIFQASRRQSYSVRLGAGFYTRKGDHWDFVDYTNFHDDNIPGGWNDSWSGEFELLPSQWYNASDYYIRGNFTYEAPMIATAWLPLIGKYIEAERLYVSSLVVNHLHPYTEWGYGVTTRAITLGIFAAFKNTKFDGVGCRFGFELFRDW